MAETQDTRSLTDLYEEEKAAHRQTIEVSAALLQSLRDSAMADREADVAVPAQTILRLLDHIDELRLDLSRINEFVEGAEKEEESYSPAISAWNDIVYEFHEVPRLYSGDLTIIQEPLIDRMDEAQSKIGKLRHFVQCQINRYNSQTSVKARKIMAILDGESAE